MKLVYLIRHGESEANAGLKTNNPKDVKLTAKGHKEAESISKLITEKPDLIVNSSYLRTKQTARPLFEKYPDTKQEEWNIHEFTYLSPSTCENSTIKERLPKVKKYWEECEPRYCDGVGAESFEKFINRVREMVDKIRNRKEMNIILITHQQFIAAVEWVCKNKNTNITQVKMREYKEFLNKNGVKNGGMVKINL